MTNCSSDKSFKIGVSPDGIPITLFVDNSGRPSIEFTGKIKLPFLTISLSSDNYIQPYCTYVELYNRRNDEKFVFELAKNNSQFISESNGYTKVTVLKKKHSTIVRIDSDEIGNYLYVGPEPDKKPRFPEHPWRNFVVTKAFNNNVDWRVDSVGDFFADILFVIIWIITAIVDIVIHVISFVIRLIIWIFILIGYAIGIT